MKYLCLFILAGCFFVVFCTACDKKEAAAPAGKKLMVVTTLFPLYDFTRNIGKDRVNVILLLPPGMEAHSFDPKPDDIMKVNSADVFVYTNRYMEPWATDIIGGMDTGKTVVVDAGRGTNMIKLPKGAEHEHEGGAEEKAGHRHHEGDMDPHIWLDFGNAQVMVDNIAAGLAAKDPANKAFYASNAAEYKKKLAELDQKYRETLAHCEKRVLLHGGHYAFGYMAKRYSLEYESAYAVSADAEPTPQKIMDLIKKLRANNLHYIYTEELIEPRVAETIAKETGATILKLHGAHNISKADLAGGVTFLSLMERNLDNLRIGLQCKQK